MATDGRTHYEGCWHEHRDCAERHVAELEEKLAALQWTPISPDNLPRVGDEVLRWIPSESTYKVEMCASTDMTADEWKRYRYTHFRPINAPEREEEQGK